MPHFLQVRLDIDHHHADGIDRSAQLLARAGESVAPIAFFPWFVNVDTVAVRRPAVRQRGPHFISPAKNPWCIRCLYARTIPFFTGAGFPVAPGAICHKDCAIRRCFCGKKDARIRRLPCGPAAANPKRPRPPGASSGLSSLRPLRSMEVIVKIPEPLHNGLSPSCASFYVPEPANS